MTRLTITLNDDLHRALKEAAARQGRSIGKIIEESLRLRGIKTTENARQIVARARKRAQCGEEDALGLAVDETRAHRAR
jgi:predicted transcriptional regulator